MHPATFLDKLIEVHIFYYSLHNKNPVSDKIHLTFDPNEHRCQMTMSSDATLITDLG